MDAKKIRKIIHIDCDCFYAALEMRDNPALRHQAVAVGGLPGQRGVIATCNYLAREFGVHSAMSTTQALRKCPQLIVIAPVWIFIVRLRAIFCVYFKILLIWLSPYR